jgi:hypothetical protein
LKRLKLNIDAPDATWYEQLFNVCPKNDFIITCSNTDMLRWFGTNLTQHLCRIGGHEVVPMYGMHINDLETCCYQLNLSLPVGYEFNPDYHALFDTLLNFETEPPRRMIIWNDAQFLLNEDPEVFEAVFEVMVVAAYVNREGVSTIKEDGTRYTVDQRNIFIFENESWEKINSLLDKEYYITSIDGPFYQKLEFNTIELIDDSAKLS